VTMAPAPTPIEDRLFPKLRVTKGGCWIFTGCLDAKGYGRIWCADERRPKPAHVVAFEFVVGLVPAGLVLDHECRNRACCNPAHLDPVTVRVNTRRGLSGHLITHCPQGHAYTEENIYWYRGHRYCRTCRKQPLLTVSQPLAVAA